jgi:hypothetical protein
MDYEYKLVCDSTVKGLNNQVNSLVIDGYRPLGQHTHQKSNHSDVIEQHNWNNVFCLSMCRQKTTNN